jgi:hypothetical protein
LYERKIPQGDGVVIGWLFRAREGTDGWFTHSIADLFRWDAQGPRHIVGGDGGFICIQSGPRIAESRNAMVDAFAQNHQNAQWLLTVDSDMTFDCTILEQLLEVADPIERPIVGALCFAPSGDNTPAYPTIYREVTYEVDGKTLVGVDRVDDYPENTLMRVGGTGAAGMLVHRSVFSRLRAPWPEGFGTLQNGAPNPYPWYSEGLVAPDGKPLGEDIAFCRRAAQVGIPIHVHTGIQMGHMKVYKLDAQYFRAQQVQLEAQGDRSARRRAARAQAKMSA